MSKRNWIIIWLVTFLLGLLFMNSFTKKVLDDRPELKMAQIFIASNDVIREEFGEVKAIDYQRRYSKITSGEGWASGEYAFQLEGSKKSGIIRLKWSSRTGRFEPQEIELIFKYKLPQRIWVSQ